MTGFPSSMRFAHWPAICATYSGAECKLTYGADWTEYFGHHPQDGSGDVYFHLDPLWAHPAITAVGIDNYMPLSDWRDEDYGAPNPDGFSAPYDFPHCGGRLHRVRDSTGIMLPPAIDRLECEHP